MGKMMIETQLKTELCVKIYAGDVGKLGEIFAFAPGVDKLVSPLVFYHFLHFFEIKLLEAGLSPKLKYSLRKAIDVLKREEKSRDIPNFLERDIVVDGLILQYGYRTVSASRFV